MQEQATGGEPDANGQAVALHVEGDVSLPVAARRTVGSATACTVSRTLLVTADGAIVTPERQRLGRAREGSRAPARGGRSRHVNDLAVFAARYGNVLSEVLQPSWHGRPLMKHGQDARATPVLGFCKTSLRPAALTQFFIVSLPVAG